MYTTSMLSYVAVTCLLILVLHKSALGFLLTSDHWCKSVSLPLLETVFNEVRLNRSTICFLTDL